MNAKQWMSVIATAVIIPGSLAACAHEKAPVVASPGANAYWESELPHDEPSLRTKPEGEGAPAKAPDETTGDTERSGHSDTFLWDKSPNSPKSSNSTETPSAQEPLRSHKPRLDERTNTPREPLF